MTNSPLPDLSRKVYEAMADNNINPGCILTDGKYDIEILLEHSFDEGIAFDMRYTQDNSIGRLWVDDIGKWKNYKIIGHPVRLGDVLQWIDTNNIEQRELDKQIARKGKDTQFTYTSVINQVLSYRPKDHLSHPIPLDPTKEWRGVLEFLVGLIEKS